MNNGELRALSVQTFKELNMKILHTLVLSDG